MLTWLSAHRLVYDSTKLIISQSLFISMCTNRTHVWKGWKWSKTCLHCIRGLVYGVKRLTGSFRVLVAHEDVQITGREDTKIMWKQKRKYFRQWWDLPINWWQEIKLNLNTVWDTQTGRAKCRNAKNSEEQRESDCTGRMWLPILKQRVLFLYARVCVCLRVRLVRMKVTQIVTHAAINGLSFSSQSLPSSL